jgi:hypothetical protein
MKVGFTVSLIMSGFGFHRILFIEARKDLLPAEQKTITAFGWSGMETSGAYDIKPGTNPHTFPYLLSHSHTFSHIPIHSHPF